MIDLQTQTSTPAALGRLFAIFEKSRTTLDDNAKWVMSRRLSSFSRSPHVYFAELNLRFLQDQDSDEVSWLTPHMLEVMGLIGKRS